MAKLILGLVLWAMAAGLASAACVGRDLFDDLSAAQRTAIASAAARVPHAYGTTFVARRGGARMLLVGTFHFTDDRHHGLMDGLAPRLAGADALLVEAGPEEETRLQARLARDPTLMADPTGPTLPERLDPADWQAVAAALAGRGIPAVIASRLRPWYVATMLSVSPCVLAEIRAAEGPPSGLDHLMMDAAQDADVPIRALEPFDTVFTLFDGLTPEEEIDMILAALPGAAQADDLTTTAATAFFEGRVWELWEFARLDAHRHPTMDPAAVDRQLALARERLMDRRNRAWIGPLTRAAEAAAARGRHVVAAFGALHLPGETGVLRLLERDGWSVERIALDHATEGTLR